MVKFEFTLEDAEAEALLDCISGEMNKLRLQTLRELFENGSTPLVDWYNMHLAYLDNIKSVVAAGSSRA
jgi:hypothetical protein